MEQSISSRPGSASQERSLKQPPSTGVAVEAKLTSPKSINDLVAPEQCSKAVARELSPQGEPPQSASSSASPGAGRIPTALPLPPTPAPPRSVQPPPAETERKRKRRRRRRRPTAFLRYYRTWTAAALLVAGGLMGMFSLLLIAYLMGADPLGLASQDSQRPTGLDEHARRREGVHLATTPAEMPYGFTESEEEIDKSETSSSKDIDASDASSSSDADHSADDASPAEEDATALSEDRSIRERLWQLRKRRGRFRPRP